MVDENAEIVKAPSDGLAQGSEATPLLEVIARIVKDPTVDVDKLERVLAMQERVIADQRKQAFIEAKARIEADLPQIEKKGRIVVKGMERSRFAKLEDIDTVLRPMLGAEGFSLSFDSKSIDAKIFIVECELSHRAGYSEKKTLTLPIDSSDYRSVVQNAGSSISYARRQLIKMHFNIIEVNEDNDANGPEGFVSQKQADELRLLLADGGGAEKKFLDWLKCEAFEEIPLRDYDRAKAALERIRDQKAPAK